jgi:hypothetical protein
MDGHATSRLHSRRASSPAAALVAQARLQYSPTRAGGLFVSSKSSTGILFVISF